MAFLDGAFNLNREPRARRALPPPGRAAVADQDEAGGAGAAGEAGEAGGAGGGGDDVSAAMQARGLAAALLVLGILLALVLDGDAAPFKPTDGFIALTGFYVAAQAIERLLELLPAGLGSKQAKANRAVIFPALGFLIAVVAAEHLGLYYMHALGATGVSLNLDVIVTALAIGGGTKPLHDAIKRIEKSKETPPATT